jgi:ABC-type phosphate transport system substrate-binding protein
VSLRRATFIAAVFATLVAAGLPPSAPPARGAKRRPPAPAAAPAQARPQVELAIIVNKSNPNDNLSFPELREYFMAERSNWSSGAGKVRVIMREPGVPEREAVLRLVYDMSEKDFNSYFLGKKFRGEILEEPRQRTSTPDMIKTIANLPGAIGYVRADEVDASVKVIRVDGLTPGDAGYRIKQ